MKPALPDPASREQRPWGWFETLAEGPGYRLKRLVLQPGQRLSLQRHHQRSEHWLVAAGAGELWLEGQTYPLTPGTSAHIPCGALHRASARGPVALEIIELQRGAVLSEADIERVADDYGRVG